MKMLLRLVLLISFIPVVSVLSAQEVEGSAYSFDFVEVEKNFDGDFVFTHTIRKGETIYRLSRMFGLKSRDIFQYNPHLENTIISIGEELVIPLNLDTIETSIALGENFKGAIPIIYTVKPKENLFRISRIYFNQPLINLVKRNKMDDSSVSMGERLTVGWFISSYDNAKEKEVKLREEESQKMVFEKIIKASKSKAQSKKEKPSKIVEKPVEETPVKAKPELEKTIRSEEIVERVAEDTGAIKVENKESIKKPENTVETSNKEEAEEAVIEEDEIELTVQTSKGMALWKRDSADTENLFALHATAKVNTMIEITNPMLGRKVLAKVIGNLPKNSYPDSVILVVTPKVAKDLGIMDTRFFVELRYLE